MGKIYSESSVLIGYPSGQDGSTRTVYTLPAQDFLLSLDKKVFFGHIINPFTDKAYSFKMTVYWPHFALHLKQGSWHLAKFLLCIHHTWC